MKDSTFEGGVLAGHRCGPLHRLVIGWESDSRPFGQGFVKGCLERFEEKIVALEKWQRSMEGPPIVSPVTPEDDPLCILARETEAGLHD